MVTRMLGDFTVSRGKDKKGEYISYADQYDFPKILQNKMKGKPYKICKIYEQLKSPIKGSAFLLV